MSRELNVHMSFYLSMRDGETKEEAEYRFYKTMEGLASSDTSHESSVQVYETSVQEV